MHFEMSDDIRTSKRQRRSKRDADFEYEDAPAQEREEQPWTFNNPIKVQGCEEPFFKAEVCVKVASVAYPNRFQNQDQELPKLSMQRADKRQPNILQKFKATATTSALDQPGRYCMQFNFIQQF